MSSHAKSSNQKSPEINHTSDHADLFAALKIRDFRIFAIGHILIFTSVQMQLAYHVRSGFPC